MQGKDYSDDINDGIFKQVKLQTNDLILIGTDGVFDNLFDEEIIKIVGIKNNSYRKIYYS